MLFADEGLDLRVPRLLQVGGTRLFSGSSLDERAEFVGRGRQGLAELARGGLDLSALAHRAVAVLFATGLFGLPAGDLVAAALALAKLKVGERAAPCDEIGLNRADVLLMRAALVLELRGLGGQKVRAPGLAVGGSASARSFARRRPSSACCMSPNAVCAGESTRIWALAATTARCEASSSTNSSTRRAAIA
ncbi:MAG: hypothetical protein ACLUNV_05420 [Sutterella wadsworthensis]